MEYLVPPWRHQLEAISRAENLPCFALFFEMGAGKTSTAINILRGKFNAERRVLRTLILCPPIVVRNWRDEWLRHSRLDPGKIILLTGTGKARVSKFTGACFGDLGGERVGVGGVVVTNYESLLMPDLLRELQVWAPEAVVLDESHKCKDPKAKRTKLAIQLASTARFRYLLSGSPVLNSPLDLFAQFLILDNGQTFGRNFFAFRARYFRDKNAGMPRDRYFPKWEILPGALDEINRLIFEKGMRVEKKDCMDLPPLVRQTIKVGMTPTQERLYKEMKRDFITFIKDKACTATLAITKALRLQQIASGYVKTMDGTEVQLDGSPKQEALRELLEEITVHSKVLVWAVFKQNYEQIRQVCESLGVEYVEVHGEVTDRQKADNVARFNTDPKCRVFIGHPGSGGIGINLVAASYSIFYSRSFSLEHSLQAEARNHRGGAEIHDKITRIDLVSADTIDELVQEKLANKQEVSDKILRDLSLELEKQAT
jgi:SNF2 family DNA or RNA helicase